MRLAPRRRPFRERERERGRGRGRGRERGRALRLGGDRDLRLGGDLLRRRRAFERV